jgi:hypothetical protein
MIARLRASPLTTVAVLLSLALAIWCYVLPMRGLTFLWDDWVALDRLNVVPAPRSWLEPYRDHWAPVFFAIFDAQYHIFGPEAWAFIIVVNATHVLNVALVGVLLRTRGHDDAVAAVGTAGLGVATV